MITTSFYLDTRYARRDGLFPLKISLSARSRTAYISLDVFLPSEQWDPVRRVIRKSCPNHRRLNEYALSRKAQVDECVRSLLLDGAVSGLSAVRIRDAVLARLYGDGGPGRFLSHYLDFAERHENARTREIYLATSVAMGKYDPVLPSRDFADIDKSWLDGFYLWLARNGSPSVNARGIHLRNIRAAFNDAIDSELTSCYPFRKYRIRSEATPKRALSVEQLRSIFFADVPGWQRKYVDAFMLIFCLVGINTVDLLGLRREDLSDGRISYRRAKTHRLYDVRVEDEAKVLLDRYAGRSKLLSFDEGCSSYRHWAMKLNRNLSAICPGVTSYTARHSWATIAASLDIPKETIAAALGHGGNTVTDIYISFDRKKVDDANRRVLDWVFHGRRS